jgi:molybdopterin converting factor small subunit
MNDLTLQFPALRPHLYSDDGRLRAFVNLYLNDEDIRQLQGTGTLLHEGDRLLLIPSIAGGIF